MFAWRKPLVLLLCVLLVLARGVGLHTHWSHDDHAGRAFPASTPSAHTQTVGDHAHEHVNSVSNYATDHVTAHLVHGDVDAEEPGQGVGKLPSLTFVALVAIACLFLLPLPRSPARVFAPPPLLRPRRWTYFKPLSHAPPAAV